MIEKGSLIDPSFLPNCNEPTDNKYYQEFKLFISQKGVMRWIEGIRKSSGINPADINKRLEAIDNTLKKRDVVARKMSKCLQEKGVIFEKSPSEYFKTQKKFDYARLRDESHKQWGALENYVNSKVKRDDIVKILRIFNKPSSWEYSLISFFLTGKIVAPSVKIETEVDRIGGRIILKLSAEATMDDIRGKWGHIEKLQSNLRGYDIKYGARVKKKFNEKERIIATSKKYNDPYTIIDKVYGVDDDFTRNSGARDRKRIAVIRKTKQRYKSLL